MEQLPLFNTNYSKSNLLKAHRPRLITKELQGNRTPEGKRRIRLSSNLLEIMGFTAGSRIEQTSLGFDKGITLQYNPKGATKIYQRSYTNRKNNPFETQIDIQNQKLINDSFPDYINRFHFTIEKGIITVKGLINEVFAIRKNMKHTSNKLRTFMAMSSGIDMHCAEQLGFTIDGLLEYRPQEKRDKTNLTETGVINALINGNPDMVFNEDISKINWNNIERLLEEREPIAFLHLCLQCDDFSNAKAQSLKDQDVETLNTSSDLVYDGLRMIETIKPAVILVENVPGFTQSESGQLLRIKLRKWGYFVEFKEMDARNYGGLTSRKRYYMVASIWPNFQFPTEFESNLDVWNQIKHLLPECRDVTHSKALHNGIKLKRARIISKGKRFAPTVLKSQNRQAKDSIYIEHEGRYLFPSEEVLKTLNGFPSSINLNGVGSSIASEIIGQSIDYPTHHLICEQIKNHINLNAGSVSITKFKNTTTL